MPEIISHRIENKEDIVVFGCMGIKRELIEWYTITEVNSNQNKTFNKARE